MFVLIASGIVVTGGLAYSVWRTAYSNRRRWPADPTFDQQLRLVRRFLRSDGWKLGEPMPWINVFVRAQRNGMWLNLAVHTKDRLGLATLIKDSFDFALKHQLIIGIVSQESIPAECAADADRIGLFVMHPSELGNAENIIRQIAVQRAAERRKVEKDHAPAPFATKLTA